LLFAEPGKSKILFVKNLSFDTNEKTLKTAFKGVTAARINYIKGTRRSKG